MDIANTNPQASVNPAPVYSPGQSAFAAFLGGPLASIWCMRSNFQVLGKEEWRRKTGLYGAFVLVAMILVLPFLPDKFPNFVIPVITIGMTQTLVQRYQFSKQAIIESRALVFHSNWRAAGIGLLAMVITIVAIVAFMSALQYLGVGG